VIFHHELCCFTTTTSTAAAAAAAAAATTAATDRLIPIPGPGIEISPFCQTQQNRQFHLKTGAEPAPKMEWLNF
jgi:hypothetical protein